jgi:hypothetical protein
MGALTHQTPNFQWRLKVTRGHNRNRHWATAQSALADAPSYCVVIRGRSGPTDKHLVVFAPSQEVTCTDNSTCLLSHYLGVSRSS